MNANRNGFALITVLWLIAALASVVALEIGAVRLGNQVSTNRIVLSRGRWAAEACLAIAQGRWAEHRMPDTALFDLGEGARCSWHVDDPTTRINVNSADAEVLRGVGWSEAFYQAVIESRRREPFQSVGQLTGLPSYDSSVVDRVTVLGPGSINVTAAAREVLRVLPGLTAEAVDLVLYRRSVGRPIKSLDELAAVLSPSGRAALLDRYADLARVVTFAPPQLIVRAEGWVVGFAPRATIEVTAVPLAERLAIVGRRMW
jgi:DNA uptake protein ComE-like DNA-binding protein